MVAKRKSGGSDEKIVDTESIDLFIAGADRSEVGNLVRTKREIADQPFQMRFTKTEVNVMDETKRLMGSKSRAELIRCLIAEKYEELKF